MLSNRLISRVARHCFSVCMVLTAFASLSTAYGQRGWPGSGFGPPASTSFRGGGYNQVGRVGGHTVHHNPVTGAVHVPNVGVAKNSGIYSPIGNGYYQNARTGNVYNPTTGSYTTGKQVEFRPGGYNNLGGNVYHNPVTNSVHVPGVGVAKDSGMYRPIGNGYYRNPVTGNVYNPTTGIYKSR